MLTDSGGTAILSFHQYGDIFQLDTPIQDPASYTSSAPANTELTHTLTYVPVGISCRVQLSLHWYSTTVSPGPVSVVYSSGYCPSLTVSSSLVDIHLDDGGSQESSTSCCNLDLDILLPTDATIKTDQEDTHADQRLIITIHSWIDLRGKDGTT